MDPVADRLLEGAADIVVAPDPGADTLRRMVGDADVLVVRSQLPADLLDRPHRLLGIVRHGTGVDMIPVDAATAQAVPVANVPNVNARAVAEYCAGAMLALARRLHRMDRDLHDRGWQDARRHASGMIELGGRTLGIVGFGAIGRALAEIAHHGFGMRVLAFRRRTAPLPGFVQAAALDELLAQSDVVSLNCPLTPETRNLLDARRIALMKPGAFLVNSARGAVVDEAALVAALTAGRIGGAALDVFTEQPLARDHPLLALPNVLLTPHAAGLTQEASRAMGEGAAQAVLRLLAGERPEHLVNPEVWDRVPRRRARS